MRYLAFLLLLLSCLACGTSRTATNITYAPPPALTPAADPNPAAAGFNAAASDSRAIALADSVMAAMGGRQAWDNTRYIRWNFLGRRSLLWDKNGNRVRIDIPDENTVYLLDMNTGTGRVRQKGQELSQPDSLAKYLGRAKSIWINDSYWLVQPFKLKDSGVTLKYGGREQTPDGKPAEVLELTFENVGDTPQNRYRIFIDPQTHRQIRWEFYANAGDEKPRFSMPWNNYQRFGKIWLSGDRGERHLTDIAVYDTVPEAAFSDFSLPDLQ